MVGGAAPTLGSVNPLNLFAFYPGINLGATIQALEQKGLAEVLAEPNVMAKNGHQASFLAGGEYPYPVAQSGATGGAAAPITIQYKEYGVLLTFLPTITNRGTIRLQVAPEVSALDYANAVNIGGATVPALTVRRVKTEVELSDGQSFVIGGLLDNRETDNFEKIPFLGDIPILGRFFQSMQRTKSNTELIVIVTPEIVNPIDAGTPRSRAEVSGRLHTSEFSNSDAYAGYEGSGHRAAASAGNNSCGEAGRKHEAGDAAGCRGFDGGGWWRQRRHRVYSGRTAIAV